MLEDEVLYAIEDLKEQPFTIYDLIERCSGNYNQVWRVLSDLEKSNRVSFSHYKDRRKYYTSTGLSRLPYFKLASGYYPCSIFLKSIESVYEQPKVPIWSVVLNRINKIPLLISQLFVTAHEEVEQDRNKHWRATLGELIEARRDLTKAVELIDVILQNKISGDFQYYREVMVNDSQSPTPTEITDFLIWVRDNYALD